MISIKMFRALLVLLGYALSIPPVSGAERFRADRVYVDSVPRGATVSLLPKKDGEGKAVILGKTPLELDPRHVPSMRFAIVMNMAEYAKVTASLPGMPEWIRRFQAQELTASSTAGHSDYFDFDTPALQSTPAVTGTGLLAIGPEYTLDYPAKHRLVALFIPKGFSVSTFYPLMPPSRTFPLGPAFGAGLMQRYGLLKEQADEAVGALSRCGKYTIRLKDPLATELVITVQKGNVFVQKSTTEK